MSPIRSYALNIVLYSAMVDCIAKDDTNDNVGVWSSWIDRELMACQCYFKLIGCPATYCKSPGGTQRIMPSVKTSLFNLILLYNQYILQLKVCYQSLIIPVSLVPGWRHQFQKGSRHGWKGIRDAFSVSLTKQETPAPAASDLWDYHTWRAGSTLYQPVLFV